MTIIRKFVINEKILKNELMWEENKEKRELYKKTHTKEQKLEIYLKWKEFMNEICEQVSFFDYIKNYYPMNLNVLTKLIEHKVAEVVASPLKVFIESEIRKVVEQNNYKTKF